MNIYGFENYLFPEADNNGFSVINLAKKLWNGGVEPKEV